VFAGVAVGVGRDVLTEVAVGRGVVLGATGVTPGCGSTIPVGDGTTSADGTAVGDSIAGSGWTVFVATTSPPLPPQAAAMTKKTVSPNASHLDIKS